MSSSDEEVVQGPTPSGEWVRRHAAKIDEEDRARDQLDTSEWFAQLAAKAAREVARWKAVPCHGEPIEVSACSADVQKACEERDHLMCPRRRIARMTEEDRLRRAEKRKRLEESGMEAKVLRLIFDDPALETEPVTRLRDSWASEPRPTIVILQGGVGCGKSCAAGLWAVERGAEWITAKALARLGYESRLETLGRVPLVLDDLGTEFADQKGFFASTLDGLIGDHDAREVDLVITTNLSGKEFHTRYGERIASRLRESGRFIQLKGQDMRRRQR